MKRKLSISIVNDINYFSQVEQMPQNYHKAFDKMKCSADYFNADTQFDELIKY
ncbi:MAG: hypothetical protein IT276_07820 [Ignavibacteriaceae bacterium]|nr:hypothetical protein [Ignavibacteriaceae bacterium]